MDKTLSSPPSQTLSQPQEVRGFMIFKIYVSGIFQEDLVSP
jgi:hypothetical protein